MKYKGSLKALCGILLLGIAFFWLSQKDSIEDLHRYHLENSPFKDIENLSKKERKAIGLPPNKFNEQIYNLTIDPATGEHNYESKLRAQEQLRINASIDRYAVPGQSVANPWYEIGPKNAAGRSRAALWDLADTDGTRVFVGGVSGGLWKNEDITNFNESWTRITGVPGNLAVSIIVQDPNDTSVLYAGTGESYTQGDASGNGIYQSLDGGITWSLVFGRGRSTTVTTTAGGSFVEGYFAVNDIILYDHDGIGGTAAQVFAAIGSTYHSRSSSGLDGNLVGLYKSVDGSFGSFNRINSVNNGTNFEEINDLEVQEVSNRIWLSTTDSNRFAGVVGGRFWYSDDGITFTQATPTFPAFPTTSATNRHRTEIASSHQNTDTHYILIETSNTSSGTSATDRIPIIYKTTDNFASFDYVVTPADLSSGIPDYDFTRGQSFYDLEIEIDPNDDDIVYAGGINWFRSQNGGSSWSQISKWADAFGMEVVPSVVHADQHGMYFDPNDSDKAIVVNDGGVSYCTSLSTASNTITFSDREKDLITTQFYTVAQSPPDFEGADYILGGTQDNGTWSIIASNKARTDGTEVQGGDGAATFFDQVESHYYISNYVYNDRIVRRAFDSNGVPSSPDMDFGNNLGIPDNEGDFINPAALDSNQDVYFSCAGAGFIRVITGLERGGSPATFLLDFSGSSTSHATSFEVSRVTTLTSTLFVGLADGEVLKITNAGVDGGSTISSVYSQAGSVSDIHIGETENDIYVTYFNYGITKNIVFTEDGFATTPSFKEGDLPDFPVLSILHNPYEDGEVIIGTELGIWKTANFGDSSPNWISAEIGMSDVPVYDIDFRGVDAMNNRVVAASFGRGIYTGSFTSSNNPPISVQDAITVLEGGTVTTISGGATSVLSNDSDPEGDSMTTDLVTNTINGVLALSATGSFTYTHDDSETTTDSFSYRAYDGALYGNIVSVTITVTPVEECPLIQTPLSDITVSEDAADTVINFSATFLDPEGDALTYTVTYTNTPLLTATINTTSLTLDFTDNMVGSATVTLTANDLACGVVTSESFIVTVNAVNDAPAGIADTINVNEGETVTITSANATSVLFNDTDLEGDALTTGVGFGAIAPTVAKGTLSFLDNGTFSYTHNGSQNLGDANTTDVFYYRPFDGTVFGNTTTVTIQITHSNDCPIVAISESDKTVMEDAEDLEINIASVFTDEEADPITITVSNTNSALLSATKSSATTLTIDFVDNMTGSSTIILYATDGTAACSSLVSTTFIITVVPQNDPPVGTPDIINVNENETASSTTISNTVLANDTDTEGDDLTATLVPGSGPFNHSGGAFSLQSSGTFVYNHDGSETTTDTFNYTLSDALSSSIVSVTINIAPINDCPIIDTFLPDITVNEDAADTVINLSPYFSDAEGNALTFSFTNANTSIATVTLNTSTLTIQYIPEQNGTTTLTISVDDLNGCSTVQDVFLVNISAVNDPPVTVTENLSVLEGGTVTTTVLRATSLLDNDTDTENDPLEAILTTPASNGTVALSSTGTFTYTHDGSETTTDTFQYRAAEIAGLDGNIVLVNITILEVNDCPVHTAVGGFPAADEDGAAWTWNYGAEISDADGNTPLYTLTHTATDLLSAVTNANGVITFTPEPDQWGTTTMTLNVSDGRGCAIDIVIPVVINSINDCPTLENPTADITAFEDDPDLFIPLVNIFADIDTSSMSYSTSIGNNSIVATSFTSTALIIDFLPNQSGSTFINLIASDGDLSCSVDDLFTVSVSPVNDPPTGIADVVNLVKGGTTSVLNDGVTTSVLTNDSDPEGEAITAIEVTPPVNGTLTLLTNGNFTYTHDNSATVTDSFTYTPRDTYSNIGNTTTVTIYINNPPVGVTETIALFEGGTATTTTAAATSVLSNDTDADTGDDALLTATIGTSPLYGTLALNADGSFTYTHSGSEDFTDSFTYIPFDGKGYGLPTVVSVTVTPTNDAPVAFPDSITVGIGQTTSLLTGGMNSVLANDTDADGDSLTAILVSGTSSGTLVLNAGGTFSYTQNGVMDAGDSFTYKARDSSNLDSNVVTVNISLTCSPCTEKTIEAGSSGVIVSYRGCDCRKYDVYVPKGKVFIFCHLDGSVSIDQGSYTVLSSKVCY
ncbi:Ig-like domain-containing protein [Flavobacteriaceae bacterium]|nr:Ig-like domain-containing protein [Flavobacteriaceae bacterium]